MLSCLTYELSGRPWLRDMIHRQKSQGKTLKCGTPPEPLPVHLNRFYSEWKSVLGEISKACPVIADDARALLRLDPLNAANDATIDEHLAPIRAALSDSKVALGMQREQERDMFADNLRKLRMEKGWSLRRLARECMEATRRIGFGVHAPDRHQLMDYERGRSNANPRTRVVLATALGVAADQIYP